MHYLAWLNTAPDSPPNAKGAAPKESITRRAQIEAARMDPAYPRVERAEYLVNYLFEFGPVTPEGAFQVGAIREIEHVLGLEFDPWEKRLLLRLSREYQGAQFAAAKPDAPCPWPEVEWQWLRAKLIQAERNLDAFCR